MRILFLVVHAQWTIIHLKAQRNEILDPCIVEGETTYVRLHDPTQLGLGVRVRADQVCVRLQTKITAAHHKTMIILSRGLKRHRT